MVCIGVIGAMEEEVSSLINQMEDAESKTMAGMTFYKGTLWNQDTVVVQSGIGKVNMAICTQILVNIYGVDTQALQVVFTKILMLAISLFQAMHFSMTLM